MLKMTERAKAALEEQQENPKKRKKGTQSAQVVPKRVRSELQTGNSSSPSSPVSATNNSRQATVKDTDDEYDTLHRERVRGTAVTQPKSRKPIVEDVDDIDVVVGRGQSMATAQSAELESEDEPSVFIL